MLQEWHWYLVQLSQCHLCLVSFMRSYVHTIFQQLIFHVYSVYKFHDCDADLNVISIIIVEFWSEQVMLYCIGLNKEENCEAL